jgi:hypothetical protein
MSARASSCLRLATTTIEKETMRVRFQEGAGGDVGYNDILTSTQSKELHQKVYKRAMTMLPSSSTSSYVMQSIHEQSLMDQIDSRAAPERKGPQTKRFKDPLLDSKYLLLSIKSKKKLFGRSYLSLHRASGDTVAIARVKKPFRDQFHIVGGEEGMLDEIRDIDPLLGNLREKIEYAGDIAYVLDVKKTSNMTFEEPEFFTLPEPCVYCDPNDRDSTGIFETWLFSIFGKPRQSNVHKTRRFM